MRAIPPLPPEQRAPRGPSWPMRVGEKPCRFDERHAAGMSRRTLRFGCGVSTTSCAKAFSTRLPAVVRRPSIGHDLTCCSAATNTGAL
jgi:hypothetical protein